MKRSLLTMAAALALVGCSQDDLVQGIENRPTGAIGVNAYVPTVGRGTALNSEGDLVKAENGFDLYAFLNDGKGTQFMGDANGNGIAFQGSGANGSYSWNYVTESEMRFWSEANDSPIKFVAVSPMNEKTTHLTLEKNIAYGSQTLEYTVPATCSEQVDLMYAVTGDYASNDESAVHVMNGIDLQFHHALSQIVFKAKTESALLYADVTKVEIKNLYGAGTFDMATAETYRTADDRSTATFPWTYGNETATSVYAAQLGTTTPTDINTQYDEDGNETGTTNSNGNYQDGRLTDSSESLLLIPQNLKTNKTVLAITCSVRFNGDNGLVTIVEDKTIEVPITTNWQPGYKYTYTLVFSADMGELIKVKSVGVDVWNDGGNTDVEYSPNRIVSYKSTEKFVFEGNPFGTNSNPNPIVSHTFEDGVGTVVCQNDIQIVRMCTDLSEENGSAENVTEIVIPESARSISALAFIGMTFSSITVPKGVSYIGNYAFGFCTELKTIDLQGNISSIDAAAFSGCTALESVYLGKNVDLIDLKCFEECTSLKNLYIGNNEKVVVLEENSGIESNTSLTVHVPAALYEAYCADDGWKNFTIVVAK